MNPYAVFNLDSFATLDEVKARYRELAKANHPDIGGDATAMITINTAYELLKTQSARQIKYQCKPIIETILDELIETRARHGYKKGWIYYRFMRLTKYIDLSLKDYLYVARRLDYKDTWAQYQYFRRNRCKYQ